MVKARGLLACILLAVIGFIFLDVYERSSTNTVTIGINIFSGVVINHYFWNTLIAVLSGLSAFAVFIIFFFVVVRVVLYKEPS